MKNKTLFIKIVSVCLLFSMIAGLSLYAVFAGGVYTKPAGIEKIYLQNTIFTAPDRSLDVDGKNVLAKATLSAPDGRSYIAADYKLEQIGQYTLTYSANGDQRVVSERETFNVVKPLYSTKSSAAKWGRAAGETQKDGLVINLKKDDTFSYNKPLNIAEMTQDQPIVELFCAPEELGKADALQFSITLKDAYDETNFVTIAVQCAEGDSWQAVTGYVRAGATNQLLCGIEYRGGDTIVHKGDKWGTNVNFNLYGNGALGSDGPIIASPLSKNKLSLYFDYESRTIYAAGANGQKFKVIDLTDATVFPVRWKGFSQGKALLSLTGGLYKNTSLQLVVTDIGNEKLHDTGQSILQNGERIDYIMDNTPPIIEQKAETVPNAFVDVPYKVFDCDVTDEEDANPKLQVYVWRNYGSSTQAEINVRDGYFIPKSEGAYVIEYRAVDRSGNVNKKTVRVIAYPKDGAGLVLTTEEGEAGYAGENVAVPRYSVQENNGDYKVKITATLGDIVYDVDETLYFRPEYAGEYEIKYSCSDYTHTVTAVTSLTVKNGRKLIFIEQAQFPDYLIKGFEYEIPNCRAFDYSTGKPIEIVSAVTVGGAGKLRNKKLFVESAGAVTVTYTARYGGKSENCDYTLRAIDTGVTGSLDMSRYFLSKTGTASARKTGVKLESSGQGSFAFIKNVLASFRSEFNFEGANSAPDEIRFVLTDSAVRTSNVSFAFRKGVTASSRSLFFINDEYVGTVSATFDGLSPSGFSIKYDNITRTVSIGTELTALVEKNSDDSPFKGFKSGRAYVKIDISSGAAGASVLIGSINNQPMGSLNADMVPPEIEFLSEILRVYSIGSLVELPNAIVEDVLKPVAVTSLTVTDPSGNVVKTVDGKILDGVTLRDGYKILLDTYGAYYVNLSVTDGVRTYDASYVINVTDTTAPELHVLSDITLKGRVGDRIKIPEVKAMDAKDGDCEVFAYLIRTDGVGMKLNGNSFKPMVAGNYRLNFFAADKAGNSVMKSYIIVIEET